MKRLQRVSVFISLVGLIGVLIMSVIPQENNISKADVVASLGALQFHNASLNYEIVKLESPQFENYDYINQSIQDFRSTLNDLIALSNDLDQDTKTILGNLKQEFELKADLALSIASNTAVMQSSVQYLTTAISEIRIETTLLSKTRPESKILFEEVAKELNIIWIDVLTRYIRGNTSVGISFEKVYCNSCPFTLRKQIESVVRHLALLETRSIYQTAIRVDIKNVKLETYLEKLSANIERSLSATEDRLLLQQGVIISGAILLIVGLLTMASLVRRNRRHYILAETDLLTGLGNRIRFERILKQVKEHTDDNLQSFGLLFIDLDGFKKVNDVLGHTEGDLVLKRYAKILTQRLGYSDKIMRFGGDEFVVIVENASIEKLRALAKKLNHYGELQLKQNIKVTLSIGGALYPDDANDIASLIEMADGAMYDAKKAGKNRYKIYKDV